MYDEITDGFHQIYLWQNMQNFYIGYQTAYKSYINTLLAEFKFELVIYDETEYFR
jgi:hypothetical protein